LRNNRVTGKIISMLLFLTVVLTMARSGNTDIFRDKNSKQQAEETPVSEKKTLKRNSDDITITDITNQIKKRLKEESGGIDRYYEELKKRASKGKDEERAYYKALMDQYISSSDRIELYIGNCRYITKEYIKAVRKLAKSLGLPLIAYGVADDKKVPEALIKTLKGTDLRLHMVTNFQAERDKIPVVLILKDDRKVRITGAFTQIRKMPEGDISTDQFCQVSYKSGKAGSLSILKHHNEATIATPAFKMEPILNNGYDKNHSVPRTKEISTQTYEALSPLVKSIVFFSKHDMEPVMPILNRNFTYGCCVDCTVKDSIALYRLHSQVCPPEILKQFSVKSVPSVISFSPKQ